MKKGLLMLAGGVVFLLAGCKKDDECNTDVASVSGSYKVSAVTYKASASSPEIDGMNLYFTEDCEKDDVITLNANGTYTVSDAGSVCTPPGDDSGNWTLTGSTIALDGNTATIQSFDCSNLKITTPGGLTAGDQLNITYVKQ